MKPLDGSSGNRTQLFEEVAFCPGEELLNIEDYPNTAFKVIFLGDPTGEPRQFMPGRKKLPRSVLQKNKGQCDKVHIEGMLDKTDRLNDVIDCVPCISRVDLNYGWRE